MSDRFKKFVTGHRLAFDTREPGKELLEKIDAQLDLHEQSRSSSKWLSRFKYLGFGLSMLAAVIYFISEYVEAPANNTLKAITINPPGQDPKSGPYKVNAVPGEHDQEETVRDLPGNKHTAQHLEAGSPVLNVQEHPEAQEQNGILDHGAVAHGKETSSEIAIHAAPKESDPSDGAKKNTPVPSRKKAEIVVPPEPNDVDSYTGTLYDNTSLCAVLHVYRFPGKVNVDKGGGIEREHESYRTTIKTMSCNNLQNLGNVKAIWLKGRTSKELTLSVKKKFKNILLVKRDGRELHPYAISHYYPGLGVLSEFKGRYFNMMYKDKVELILFFKDAEEGDKVLIDGIEAVVKAQP